MAGYTTAMPTSFKVEVLQGLHNFTQTSGNDFKVALGKASPTGTYDATTGIFTVGAGRTTGEDSLLLWDSDSTAGLEIEAVVLVGVNATEANYFAAASGVLAM